MRLCCSPSSNVWLVWCSISPRCISVIYFWVVMAAYGYYRTTVQLAATLTLPLNPLLHHSRFKFVLFSSIIFIACSMSFGKSTDSCFSLLIPMRWVGSTYTLWRHHRFHGKYPLPVQSPFTHSHSRQPPTKLVQCHASLR